MIFYHWNCAKCTQLWVSTVKERINGETECPYCSGKKPVTGKTSFAVTRPDLMEEWNAIANWMLLDPNNVLPDNQKRGTSFHIITQDYIV